MASVKITRVTFFKCSSDSSGNSSVIYALCLCLCVYTHTVLGENISISAY